ANGPDRRCVAQPKADGIRVVCSEVVKRGGRENVTAVVETDDAKPFPDARNRNAEFRVENEESISPRGYLDVGAGTWNTGIAASQDHALRARAVEGIP